MPALTRSQTRATPSENISVQTKDFKEVNSIVQAKETKETKETNETKNDHKQKYLDWRKQNFDDYYINTIKTKMDEMNRYNSKTVGDRNNRLIKAIEIYNFANLNMSFLLKRIRFRKFAQTLLDKADEFYNQIRSGSLIDLHAGSIDILTRELYAAKISLTMVLNHFKDEYTIAPDSTPISIQIKLPEKQQNNERPHRNIQRINYANMSR